MVITKAALTKKLIKQSKNMSKQEATQFVEIFFESISQALERGEEVKLSGFGTFHILAKKERPGRNPKTGEAAVISARRVVTFHPSQKLKAKDS